MDVYAVVRVDDADEGPSGRVASLQIVDGDEDGYFRVQRVTGVDNEFTIAVLRLLDRERSPHGASARFFYCSVALSRFDRPIGRGSFANEPVARDGRLRIVHRPLMTSLVHWLANEASASRSLDVNRPINTSRFFTSQLESKE